MSADSQSSIDLDPEIAEELREYIHLAIATGFRPISEIQQAAIEVILTGYKIDKPELLPAAQIIMNEELAMLHDAQRDWPEVTDCDRLDAAFATLEDSGIVARQNAFCCQSCADDELWEEVHTRINNGEDIRGITFYHEQDTEAAIERQGVYLSFGAIQTSEEAGVALGQEIQRALEQNGLQVAWPGRTSERIFVALDWKRRHTNTPSGRIRKH